MDLVMKLLLFVLMLGGLVLVHELGHYLAALAVGVRVQEFGLGLPPRLLKLGEWRGTTFALNWVPFGGYVRPAGEFDPSQKDGLAAAAPWARLLVFVAGPFMNLLTGFVILVVAFMLGWPDQVQVAKVLPGSPAEAAGLQVGDVVLSAAGQPVHEPETWVKQTYASVGQPMPLLVQRGSAQLTLVAVPNVDWDAEARPLGVELKRLTVAYPLGMAMRRAWERIGLQATETYAFLARLATGQTSTTIEVRGLVGLKQITDKMVDKARQQDSVQPLLNLVALVSIGLALTNLLPFAALDGGRMAFAFLEILRRKPVNARIEKWVHAAGMVVILALMVALIVQDVLNPVF